MPSEDTLRSFVASAVYAPSGDNAQPWEFDIRPGVIFIFNTPDSDGTLYNFKQRGSYIGHGALIENIVLLASAAGYDVAIDMFPDVPLCTVMLTLGAAKPKVEPLCAAIPNRSTNRKPYTGAPLSPAHTAALLESIQGDRDVSLTLLEEKEKVQTFAKVVSLNEQLLMENRPLHDFLFSMIRWSPEEEAMTPGLYIKTMELPPPVRFLFKRVLFRWSWVLFLNRIGFSRMISKQTAALYSTSSAFGVITIPSLEDKNFLQAGRALQKIWLTATNLGLSLQPVTALPYLSQRVQAGEALAFSDEHQQLIIEADGQIRQLAAIPKVATIAMVFRIGYAPSPSASSAKRKPIFR